MHNTPKRISTGKKVGLMRLFLGYGWLGILIAACGQMEKPKGELAKLQAQIFAAGNKNSQQQLADRWWSEYQKQGIPLVHDSTVLFLYKGPAKTVRLVGDMTSWQPGEHFKRLGDTDLRGLEQHYPDSARFDYQLIVDSLWTLDPANPAKTISRSGECSELRMPRYQSLTWLESPSTAPPGQIEEFTFYSQTLGNQRPIRVYLPPGYEQSQVVYPSLYVNAGLEYLDFAKLNLTLDHLISTGEIRPIVVVCIAPLANKRREEYGNNPKFADFICNEVVTRIQKRYRVVDNADHRAIMGAGFGGLVSFYIALRHPEVFHLVAGQSSHFGYNNEEIFSLLPKFDLSLYAFYISCGTYETSVGDAGMNLIDLHYRMRESLRMGMARFGYHEIAAGNSWASWRDDLPRLLKYLFPGERIAKRLPDSLLAGSPVNY
jgi:enterochelin esterase family protein